MLFNFFVVTISEDLKRICEVPISTRQQKHRATIFKKAEMELQYGPIFITGFSWKLINYFLPKHLLGASE